MSSPRWKILVACLAVVCVGAYWFVTLNNTRRGALAAEAAAAQKEKPQEDAIRAVLEAQVTAWNKADLDGFMAGYWKDPKLTFISGGDITQGWEPTRERYVNRYQAEGKDKMGQLAFKDLEVELLGPEAAMVKGRFDLVRGEKKDWGRFTLVLRKFTGGWKIIHDHTSVPPVEKM